MRLLLIASGQADLGLACVIKADFKRKGKNAVAVLRRSTPTRGAHVFNSSKRSRFWSRSPTIRETPM